MDWCAKEWAAGLGFLSEKYGFTVRNLAVERPEGSWKQDVFWGPTGHVLGFKRRILWIDEGEKHCEWLHEVAHLVCSPPWEQNPDCADEFGGIFGWERAVAKEFRRRGMWNDEDMKAFDDMQAVYGVGDTPEHWKSREFPYGPAEFGGVPEKDQKKIVAYVNRTLRMCGLLNSKNRPTWKQPVWNEEVGLRWVETANFKEGWPTIAKDAE